MAEGWLGHWAGDRAQVFSAGTSPKGVHPLAIDVMAEVGIDIRGHSSDHVDQYVDEAFDVVVTVCDRAAESCPTFARGRRKVPRAFADPDRADLSEDALVRLFRQVRDEIGVWARGFVDEVVGPDATRTGQTRRLH